ncbi:kinesin light chain [Colletotrichum tofieldiae]|uniref:Kinesin light chain n=1 Tax=Colletotrichum tofieldiae TaxID=708197 RepID=A0A166WXV1_9PEZI|nr:kinesin light chain [Colletotrichum tofieldiae]GKT83099.1 kinesin light chain [Colletotrichum tofieldiae]
MDGQTSFGSTTGHIAFPGAHVETGGTLNVTVSDGRKHHTTPPLEDELKFLGTPVTATTARPLFVIPFEQNNDIVDRPDVFAKLDGLLPPVADYQSAALWGLGGSGKTQIALEFAYRRLRETNCPVYWVHADNEATFTQDYEALARKAGLTDKFKGKELLRGVREWIEAQPRWLLIVDNADDLGIFGVGNRMATAQSPADETCLDDYIPRAPVGTILWTSRDERIVGSLVSARRGVSVGRMAADEALALFETSRNEHVAIHEKDAVSGLLAQLDYLPLAVSQAAAYIRRRPTPVAEYLSRLKEGKKRWRILQRSEHDRHRRREVPNSILETWSISMEHIRQEDDMAYRLLLTLAYVHNQNIPEKFISAAAQSGLDDDRQSLSSDRPSTESEYESDDNDEAVATAVARLREFSFLSIRKDQSVGQAYDMHKLVQDAARYSLSQKARRQEAAQYSKAALLLVSELFPPRLQEVWEESELWLPHVLESSNWAEVCKAGVDKEIASLLSHVSDYLYDRGRWNEQEPVDKKAILIRQRVLGEKHPKTISSRAELASTYFAQGRYEEDEKISLEVLELRQEVLGNRHPDTIYSMTELATTYHAQGKYDEAEKMTTEALELQQEVLGNKHPRTIDSMALLAAIYHAQGRYDEAEKIKTEALELRHEVLGNRHPHTIYSMAKLAATYHAQGRYDEAEKIQTEALKLQQEVLGNRHPDTINSMAELTVTYHAQGRYDEAKVIEREMEKLR